MKTCPNCLQKVPDEWELPVPKEETRLETHMLRLRIMCDYCHQDRFGIKRPTDHDKIFFEVHGTVIR
jgi:hypothetical protein